MSSSLSFQVPAMLVKQREEDSQAIYIGVVKAEDFISRPSERFVIDYFKRKGEVDEGYQRSLNEKAVDNIIKYILNETPNPLLPGSLLLNSRSPIHFEKVNGTFGILHIKEELHVIDGQHRFEAWKKMMEDNTLRNKYGNYEFPVVILSNFKKIKEIEQFYVLNSRQKRIKTDLAQRNFLQLASNNETKGLIPTRSKWQLYATKIVDVLNETKGSIWEDKIILPDDGKELRESKLISQVSFVSSLKPLFVGSEAIFLTEDDKRPPIETWSDFLLNFWKIVAKIYPEAVKNAHDYSLMKTVGVSSLHLLLVKISEDVYGNKDVTVKERQKVILDKVEKLLIKASGDKLSQNFWRSSHNVSAAAKQRSEYAGAYSSAVGHNRIVTRIMLGF